MWLEVTGIVLPTKALNIEHMSNEVFKKNRNDKETEANNQKERQIKFLEHIEVKGLVNLILTKIYWKQEKQGETVTYLTSLNGWMAD